VHVILSVEKVLSVLIRYFGSMHMTYFWKVNKEDLVLSAQISCLMRSFILWLSAEERLDVRFWRVIKRRRSLWT
jgi:hypothetical protein